MIARSQLLAMVLISLAGSSLRVEGPVPANSKAAVEALSAGNFEKFATTPLTKPDASKALAILLDRRVAVVKKTREAEVKEKRIKLGDLEMKFDYKIFGEKPKTGRSLFISMHGGGGAPAQVNDQQYENQKKLDKPEEGVYLAPRAPSDTWDLWHQSHIDPFFVRLIEDMAVFEGVDRDRVYLTGLSMGGYGTWALVAAHPERFAAIALICGGGNPKDAPKLKDMPIWVFHGAKDPTVPLARLREMVDALKEAGSGVKFTGYPDADHDSWTLTYDNPELYAWFLSHKRNAAKP